MDSIQNLFLMTGPYEPHKREITSIEEITRSFANHEREEQEFLRGYRDIVDGYENPMVKFLLQLIMSDEEKHHAVVRSITTTLNDEIVGRRSSGGLPRFERVSDEDQGALAALTEAFIKSEKDGIKEYRALVKSCGDLYGGLLILLIQTIIHDSRKHLMILEFISKKLRES